MIDRRFIELSRRIDELDRELEECIFMVVPHAYIHFLDEEGIPGDHEFAVNDGQLQRLTYGSYWQTAKQACAVAISGAKIIEVDEGGGEILLALPLRDARELGKLWPDINDVSEATREQLVRWVASEATWADCLKIFGSCQFEGAISPEDAARSIQVLATPEDAERLAADLNSERIAAAAFR